MFAVRSPMGGLQLPQHMEMQTVFLSLHICYTNASEFKPIEHEQGMPIPSFRLKLGEKE